MDVKSEVSPSQIVLRRSLTLSNLIVYGIIVVQPTAPMPLFGILVERGRGNATTAVLIAMVAMLFTAISYGRMAQVYPSAGSAFTYVGKEINPALGYITGWCMLMDYVLNPLICIIWCSKAAMNFTPGAPFWAWAIFFFILFTALNCRGVKSSARIDDGLAIAMGIVIAIFFIAAVRFIWMHDHSQSHFFFRPLYDPATFRVNTVLGGTSLAILTYIGVDGISTLSEEVENPRRNVLLASVITCLAIGALAAAEVYLAQLAWPTAKPFPDVDTAYVYVAGRVAGPWLFSVMNLTLLVATLGSGIAAQRGAARLLFGMGRSTALPRFFGAVDPKRGIPRNSVVVVGLVALVGALSISYERGAELLNYGALIAFTGVNVAAFVHYFLRASKKSAVNFLPPFLGAAICIVLWINLTRAAHVIGTIWLLAGLAFGAWRTRGFKRAVINFDQPPDVN